VEILLAGKAEEKGLNNQAFAILLQRLYSPEPTTLQVKHQKQFKHGYPPKREPRFIQVANPSSNPGLFEEGWEECWLVRKLMVKC